MRRLWPLVQGKISLHRAGYLEDVDGKSATGFPASFNYPEALARAEADCPEPIARSKHRQVTTPLLNSSINLLIRDSCLVQSPHLPS